MTRLQRLACLGLEGTPADDTIEATARLWIEIFGSVEASKLQAAFDRIERSATRWPVPAHVFDAMPAPRMNQSQPQIEDRRALPDEGARERIRIMIEACAKRLRVS